MPEEPQNKACERYQEELSAFVDHTLPQRRWQQIGYHVAGCDNCRNEAEELRQISLILSGAADSSQSAPDSLNDRLRDIAGEDPDSPLYMNRKAPGPLPTKRRAIRTRSLHGGLAAITVLASVFVLALLLAPDPPRVVNPLQKARQDHALSLAAIDANEAAGAVLLAYERKEIPPGASSSPEKPEIRGKPVKKSPEKILETLSRHSPGQLAYSGVERVWLPDREGGFHVSDVRINEVVGVGAQLDVLNVSSPPTGASFVRADDCCGPPSEESWSFVEFDRDGVVVGRQAVVIEARNTSGTTVARWWVDRDNGLVLWNERFDDVGEPLLVAGFVELSLEEANSARDRSALVIQNVTHAPALEKDWCVGFDRCPDSLGSLPLVARSTSEDGSGIRLVYSDGVDVISASWTKGVMAGVQRSAAEDQEDLRLAAWQSGEGVVTLSATGSQALFDQARDELPPQQDYEPSWAEQFRLGFSRMVGIH